MPEESSRNYNVFKDVFGKNKIKKYGIIGILIGILLAVLNLVTLGFSGNFLFQYAISFFVRNPFEMNPNCFSGDDCWGLSIKVGSILFAIVTPLFFMLLGYLKDKENYPWTIKKYLFLLLILFTIFSINLCGFVEHSVQNFIANNDIIDNFGTGTFSSAQGCDNFRGSGYEIIGDCQGYFASQNGGVDYCNSLKGSADIRNECITSYAIRNNDISSCSFIKNLEVYNQKCMAVYYIAKQDRAGCYEIKNETWKKNCIIKTSKFHSFIKWYAKLKGFDYKSKYKILP